jgi:hypothetical protein
LKKREGGPSTFGKKRSYFKLSPLDAFLVIEKEDDNIFQRRSHHGIREGRFFDTFPELEHVSICCLVMRFFFLENEKRIKQSYGPSFVSK